MFRVYYTDGSTFDGPGTPPRFNVQVILEHNEEGELITRSGGKYYILEDGVWVEHDEIGLMTWLYNSGLVLFGAMTSNSNFARILSQAQEDKAVFDG